VSAKGVRVEGNVYKLTSRTTLNFLDGNGHHLPDGMGRITVNRTKGIEVIFAEEMGCCLIHRFEV
jgi:hypothetical protein